MSDPRSSLPIRVLLALEHVQYRSYLLVVSY